MKEKPLQVYLFPPGNNLIFCTGPITWIGRTAGLTKIREGIRRNIESKGIKKSMSLRLETESQRTEAQEWNDAPGII